LVEGFFLICISIFTTSERAYEALEQRNTFKQICISFSS
jgi:hypothetical protein